MKIRVLGAGLYGCHIALHLIRLGHEVEVHEIGTRVFAGASGAIPARVHQGQHYPRSHVTREACQKHFAEFMAHYGHLTHCVPINIYAIATQDSLVDFPNYVQVLRDEIEFLTIYDPSEFGLYNVEGAIMTSERHLLIDKAREWFTNELKDNITFGAPIGDVDDPNWDLTIDCTFSANDSSGVDRYEPCVTGLVEGRTDMAVTIMDGPHPSLYPFCEQDDLLSITSAKWTPLSKKCRTYAEAKKLIDEATEWDLIQRCKHMLDDLEHFYEYASDYVLVDWRTSIRAMPKSAADSRLISITQGPRSIRIMAGKMDACFDAAREVENML